MDILENREGTMAAIVRTMVRRRRAWIITDAVEAYERGDIKLTRELLAKAAAIKLDGSN